MAHVQSAGLTRTISRRRTSIRESSENAQSRGRSISVRATGRQDLDEQELLSLTKSVSKISGANEAFLEPRSSRPLVVRPPAAKPGPFSAIREIPSEFTTPLSSRPPSPSRPFTISRPPSPIRSPADTESLLSYQSEEDDEDTIPATLADTYPDIGTIASWRGATILGCVCGAQLMDNVFMTGVNIALPAISRDFNVHGGELTWLIAAYSLTFGGFLLISGVLADRYGRRYIFCAGMLKLAIWTLAIGFTKNFIQMSIFRALQGIGAAATVPSSIGIISSYFVARDRTKGLSMFGAAGAVGFCVGLIFGGFLTSSLGWRYLFFLSAPLIAAIGIVGWFILPKDRLKGTAKPKLDFAGAGLSTAGLILLSFVLSSGGEYGWGKAFIIALMIISVLALVLFTWVEKKVSNPIMPLSLWKLPNFAALWISGFVMYGAYQTLIYYTTLIAQEVEGLSASQTAIRYLPMGATGFITSLSMGKVVERVNVKLLLIIGMIMCAVAPISSSTIPSVEATNFWHHMFPSTVLSVAGTTIVYCTITVVLLASVPNNVKSLCGGMINTAFQIGSGVGLALSTSVVDAVDVKKGHDELSQYKTGLWFCVGFAGLGVVASLLGVKNVGKIGRGAGAIAVH